MRRKKSVMRNTGELFFLMLVITVILIISSAFMLRKSVRDNTDDTYYHMSEHSADEIAQEIKFNTVLLESISVGIPGFSDENGEVTDFVKNLKSNYNISKLEYFQFDGNRYEDGKVYDDYCEDDFFEVGMQGREVIYGNGDDHYIIVPVFGENGDEAKGVLRATLSRDWLNRYIMANDNITCYIIDGMGNFIYCIDGSEHSEYSDFFEYMTKGDSTALEAAEQMYTDFRNRETGLCRIKLQDDKMFYYSPIETEGVECDWYVVTVVPTSVIDSQVTATMIHVYKLMGGISLVIIVCVVLYVSATINSRRKLMETAYSDEVTGGDNFAAFQNKMESRKQVSGYIVAMDLCGFKIINNTCGTEMGDRTIQELWKVLNSNIKEGELVARVYADRFVMFLTENDKSIVEERITKMTEEILKISERIEIPHVFPVFGAYRSVGQENIKKNYGCAVQAKELIKGRRDRSLAFYDEIDYNQLAENREIEDGFEDAVNEDRFEVWYQPKFNTEDGSMVGAEALVRMRKTDGTLVPPFKFIPLYEKNGMIPKLDEYVFTKVCKQQKQWLEMGKKIIPVSINISRVSLYFYDIVERYKKIPKSMDLSTDYVQLEITESATIDNSEISHLIDEFHDAGFEILLDDFGSGFSSLSTLNVMHFDTMKLDKSLIDYIGDKNGERLLDYITKLGQNLGMHITAEGVETKDQLDFLKELKCDDIQGYYFSKPLTRDAFENLL